MRDFFIRAFEVLLGVTILLGFAGMVLGAIWALAAGSGVQGTLQAITILVAGTLYILFVGGALYLGLGIYHNTKRMADAVDQSVGR